MRSKQPEVLVSTVHLAVGAVSESLLFLDFSRALLLCPWTNSLVFAGFRSFFRIELFWPKTRFWIFADFHKFLIAVFFLFGGVVGGGWRGWGGWGGGIITLIRT